jgi:hypothetical protein
MVLLSQLNSSSRVEQIILVIDMKDIRADSEDTEAQWERLDEILDGLQLVALNGVQVVAKRNFKTAQERTLAVRVLKVRFRRMVRHSIFRLLS